MFRVWMTLLILPAALLAACWAGGRLRAEELPPLLDLPPIPDFVPAEDSGRPDLPTLKPLPTAPPVLPVLPLSPLEANPAAPISPAIIPPARPAPAARLVPPLPRVPASAPGEPAVDKADPIAAVVAETAPSRWGYTGPLSCAAANCHNGEGRRGSQGCEYSTWKSQDPHANAYAVLMEPRSQQWVERLGYKQPATEVALCLACHSTPAGAKIVGDPSLPAPSSAEAAEWATMIRRQGVSCEACHGPAEQWLVPHTTADWVNDLVGPEIKHRDFGLQPLSDSVGRVQVCTTCHVGQADQQVNHQLIAAGHPRLFFEASAYLETLPKHYEWLELQRDQAAGGDRSRVAQQWAVGQVVTALASLDLLAYRAEKNSTPLLPRQDWPELAEFNCYSCHQDLRGPGRDAGGIGLNAGAELLLVAQPPGLPEFPAAPDLFAATAAKPRLKASLPWQAGQESNLGPAQTIYEWGTWHYPMLAALGEAHPDLDWPTLAARLKAIDDLLHDFGHNRQAEVVAEARAARTLLADHWLPAVRTWEWSPEQVATVQALLLLDSAGLASHSWDTAAQLYLGLVAMDRASAPTPAALSPEQARENAVLRLLLFPAGYNSPKNFDATRFAEQIRQARQAILNQEALMTYPGEKPAGE